MTQVKRSVVQWMLAFFLLMAVGLPSIQAAGSRGNVESRIPFRILCDGDPGTCPCPHC